MWQIWASAYEIINFSHSLCACCNQHCIFVLIGNYFADAHILLEANISRELTCHKEFESDKKVAELFSCNALSRITLCIEEGLVKAYASDVGVLFSAFYDEASFAHSECSTCTC